MNRRMLGRIVAGAVAAMAAAIVQGAAAADLVVMSSGGFSAAFRAIAPEFERVSGHHVSLVVGASMGSTPEAIPARLRRGEPADVLIMVGAALEDLIRQGVVDSASRVEVARSMIGMAVRAGAKRPDIGSVEAFRRAMLEAKTIGLSDSASGVYLSTVLFKQLGIDEQVRAKCRTIEGADNPVGGAVARGEVDVGFQQIAELLPVPGIDLVGPLPPAIQKVTPYLAGIPRAAPQPEAARELLRFLVSPAAAPAITRAGMDPAPARR